jgi:hypothetical protein
MSGQDAAGSHEFFESLIQRSVAGIESEERYPPHPKPLSRVGGEGSRFRTHQVAKRSSQERLE